ncbi:AraC family transcriptional regulator [Paenibacillus sp. MMS20-IR301]|uniref:AraC family transcriptional regulator n=1 Tax=Paenibacillus sp. MMS20-IR301 TaxID=2895946 RepID=UPI0028EDE797|nr:AraC family transcriptional regulator [Paenibacillus sp. MMS20-IR301]WNS45220.1 AraC family transcriptional regulator [Paenibacillus sp. MMS20-IR301]
MQLSNHIALWEQAAVKLIDMRQIEMAEGEFLHRYKVPASVFLLSVQGSAQVGLDQAEFACTGFQLLHGGKGAILDIVPTSKRFVYYILYYRAWIQQKEPFQNPFCITPDNPIALYNHMQVMHCKWNEPEERLNVKSHFYKFIHQVLQELHRGEPKMRQSSIAVQVITYIQEYYAEPVTLDSLAEVFNFSAYHLSSLFKEHTGVSPIDYLIRFRLEVASELLRTTEASVGEIAASVGYKDVYYFSRIFKKRRGVSPAHYRLRETERHKVAESPLNIPISSISENSEDQYIVNDNHYHNNAEKGELHMFKHAKSQSMAAMLLCGSLLLGACSNGTGTAQEQSNGNVNGNGSQAVAEESPQTRMISTPRGEVEVPAEPVKVAADQYMGHLLKLGIVPVGVRSFMLDEGWMEKADIPQETLDKIEDLGDFPMNLEKLTMLEPDLIIGSIEDYIDQYEKIGTTVFLPYWEELSTAGPLDKFRNVAHIFGKDQEAEAWIAEYEQKVADAKTKISGVIKEGETVSIIQFTEKAVYVLAATGGNYGSSTVYEMLELPATESAKKMSEGFEAISLEVLPEYLGDYIFVYNGDAGVTSSAMSSEIWQTVPAVKNGKVYLYGDNYHDEFVMEDPYSLELQLDTIVNLLLGGSK